MKNHFNSLDEVIKTSIEKAVMNARDKFPIALVKNDICIKIMDHSLASKPICVRKRKNKNGLKEVPSFISVPITCYLLVKIGRKEHMERLLKNGEVYMNSTKFFRDYENSEIGDTYEGALYIKDGRVSEYRDNLNSEKLFCLWHYNNLVPLNESIIHSEQYDDITGKARIGIDLRKLCGFTPGEDPYMVVIKSPEEFEKRFRKACKRAKAEYRESNIVWYYNEFSVNPNIRLSPFFKREKYIKQHEFRFLAIKNTATPLILKLGSLEDIADIYNVNEMKLTLVGNCA